MVIRFQPRPNPDDRSNEPSSEPIPHVPRQLTPREIEHRQRMLQHLARTNDRRSA
jgi:hypothetical protein